MGKSIIGANISVSLVIYHNDINELRKAVGSALNSFLVKKVYLIEMDKERVEYLFQNANLGFGKAHNIGINNSIKEG